MHQSRHPRGSLRSLNELEAVGDGETSDPVGKESMACCSGMLDGTGRCGVGERVVQTFGQVNRIVVCFTHRSIRRTIWDDSDAGSRSSRINRQSQVAHGAWRFQAIVALEHIPASSRINSGPAAVCRDRLSVGSGTALFRTTSSFSSEGATLLLTIRSITPAEPVNYGTTLVTAGPTYVAT